MTNIENIDKNFDQRSIYKLVESLAEGNFKNEIELLSKLVKKIVDDSGFGLNGGRVWELIPKDNTYILKYQYGKIKKIPKSYKVHIAQMPVFKAMYNNRTQINYETDVLLKNTGIELFSASGVGDLIRIDNHKYYQYVLSFNADTILQSFYETLTIISGVSSVAIRDLKQRTKQKLLNKDLERAAEIQRNLLPEHKTQFADYDIYGVCIPDSQVGGDYFDYIPSLDDEEERLSIVICDAASKGLPAAIQALFVSGALKMGVSFGTKISRLISRLNNLVWNTFNYERFVSLFFCELQTSSNRLVLYTNAGHCSPMHFHAESNSITLLPPTGGLLGILENQSFKVENLTMQPGDILVLYTDGITESQNSDHELYGENRLMNIIRKEKNKSSKEIAVNIIDSVIKFCINSTYTDDKTIVVIKREINS